MQHTRIRSRQAQSQAGTQTRVQILVAIVCALWLALGGVIPAHAAPPTGDPAGGALTQEIVPTRLLIPGLAVDAPIEAVGQDEDNFMAAPTTVARAAWYNLGPLPGEPGNAVIAGHLDDVKGRPAVFWDLDKLAEGDEIVVRLSDDREIYFEVIAVETYAADDAPLDRIFGVDFERDLNLITCDGEWDAHSKLYEKRLVVYARRIHDHDVSLVPEDSTVATRHLADAAATISETATITTAVTLTTTDVVTGTTVMNSNEHLDEPTQTSTAPASPLAPPTRSPDTGQDREQSAASS